MEIEMQNVKTIEDDLSRLIEDGYNMQLSLTLHLSEEGFKQKMKNDNPEKYKKYDGLFIKNYQNWYTEASAFVKIAISDRYVEFVSLYLPDPKRKEIGINSYKIQDWLNGIASAFNSFNKKIFNEDEIVINAVNLQVKILESAKIKLKSVIANLKGLLQADIFDSEIEAARHLHKAGFIRAAGAICGVILEKHLQNVASNHNVNTKKNPTVADLNDPLKNAGVYDVPVWRELQRLADIRNLCDHNKNREPTPEEVEELIKGTEKISKKIN